MGQHLTIVDVGWGDCVSTDETMGHVDGDAVLISVVAGAVLLHPLGVKVLLAQAVWLVFPPFGQFPLLDGSVLSAGVSLLLLRRSRSG